MKHTFWTIYLYMTNAIKTTIHITHNAANELY